MARIENLVIHCSDTPPGMKVTEGMLKQWHMGPRDVRSSDGRVVNVRYLSKDFPSRESLPPDIINGVAIKKLHGRGWDRLGYSDMILRDGTVQNITPYDMDEWVDSGEITYGAMNINYKSRHIMLVGGWLTKETRHGIFEFDEIFTDSQFIALQTYVKEFLGHYPWCKVLGHNQVQNKTCPQFEVPKFLDLIKIPDINYY